MGNYTNAELDVYEATFEQAAWDLDEDVYFSFILTIDPDRSIEEALADRHAAREAARRAALTDDQRAAEDAEIQRGVEHGMAIVRELMAKHRA